MTDTPLTIAGKTYKSRLIIGTGKYKSYAENAAALEASGADMVTVAVRRVNLSDPSKERLTDHINPTKVTFLPNTAGCFTADEALRTLRLAREAGDWKCWPTRRRSIPTWKRRCAPPKCSSPRALR